MSVFRDIPHGGRFHRPRVVDFTFEEAMERTNDPIVQRHERRGFPIRDMLIGRVNVVRFFQSSQLEVLINVMQTFINGRENWTRGKAKYAEMEKNFAKNLFNILCCVKRNIDWSVGGKPPIDRQTYETLMECYNFKSFQRHWSHRKKIRAFGYRNTIQFYYENVNTESHAQLRHWIDRDDNLMYTERVG